MGMLGVDRKRNRNKNRRMALISKNRKTKTI